MVNIESNLIMLGRKFVEIERQVDEMIERFQVSDLRLKNAIKQEDEKQIIAFDKSTSILIDEMLEFDCQGCTNCEKKLSSFLVTKFVLPEHSSPKMRKRVCERLLSVI